jgi:redox-sensitive bicupin YhaK (pirin superfamily)
MDLLDDHVVRLLQKLDRPMISLRLAAERHHDRRLKREVWRTFDPVDRTGRLADRFRALEALDESRLPPRANVPRWVGGEGEIVTYVREGTVAYDDSTGHAGVIRAGEFQRMITAHGARHSEANASRVDWAHVFQARLRCSTLELEPGLEQKRFSAAERHGGLCVIASPDARAGSLRLVQDICIYSALLEPGQHVVHELAPAHAAWLHVVQGEITLGDFVLITGDGAGVLIERAVSLTARAGSEILLFDLAERDVHGPSISSRESGR